MGIPVYQVDAFTNRPFRGNPAAVCILTEQLDEKLMQHIAREMNLSETAFLYKIKDGFNLRWFTPGTEVDLCGHATLASAHILWEMGYLNKNEHAQFYTKSGLLTASKTSDWIELNFPSTPIIADGTPGEITNVLKVKPKFVGRNKFDCLVEVDSEEIVRNIQPDLIMLRDLPIRGLIVTSLAKSDKYDFVSRFFAPAVGVDEDPVTGSAHCCLGPFWGNRLNKNELIAYQASERGGLIKVRLAGDRVYLGGQAITVLQGTMVPGPEFFSISE